MAWSPFATCQDSQSDLGGSLEALGADHEHGRCRHSGPIELCASDDSLERSLASDKVVLSPAYPGQVSSERPPICSENSLPSEANRLAAGDVTRSVSFRHAETLLLQFDEPNTRAVSPRTSGTPLN